MGRGSQYQCYIDKRERGKREGEGCKMRQGEVIDRPSSVSTAPLCPISSFSSSVTAMFRRVAMACSATPTSQLRESCHHQDGGTEGKEGREGGEVKWKGQSAHCGILTFSSASTPPNAMISFL